MYLIVGFKNFSGETFIYFKHCKNINLFKVGTCTFIVLAIMFQPHCEDPITALQNEGIQSPRHSFFGFIPVPKTLIDK